MKTHPPFVLCALRRVAWLALVLAFVPMAGCAAGPDFERPETEMPAAWTAELAAQR